MILSLLMAYRLLVSYIRRMNVKEYLTESTKLATQIVISEFLFIFLLLGTINIAHVVLVMVGSILFSFIGVLVDGYRRYVIAYERARYYNYIDMEV